MILGSAYYPSTFACAGAFAAGLLVSLNTVAAVPTKIPPASPPALPPPSVSDARPSYPADGIRVIDGDTFEARVRIWPGLETTTKVRLRGIDAPEMDAGCAEEAALAEAARNALVAMLAQGAVAVRDVGPDKYAGRVLATASARGTADIGQALLDAGLARPYRGGRRGGWCEASAQGSAAAGDKVSARR